MDVGHRWNQTLLRILGSPVVEGLAVLAVVAIALYAVFTTDAFYSAPHLPVLFGMR